MPDITMLCKRANITRNDLAKMIGTTAVSLWRYEHGQRKMPVEVAKKIAVALGINWEDFYKG